MDTLYFPDVQVDIEGHEFGPGGLEHWLATGALWQVNQLAIELHLPNTEGDIRPVARNGDK